MASSVSLSLPQRLQAAFAEASRATGATFSFLLKTATRESSLKADAKAPTSSATGMFQFIEQTWLETMKEAGPSLGYSKQANAITKVGDKYYVKDRATRQQILDMRKDPKASALMAGAYAQKNETLLSAKLGRTPSAGELYAAHFLGAEGSGQLISLAETRPTLAAHKIFPEQAQANRSIFFGKDGQPKSVADVYANLVATVPSEGRDLAKMVDLGGRFNPKSTFANQSVAGAEPGSSSSPMDQLFNRRAAMPSRYVMGYSPETGMESALRTSRFGSGDEGGGFEAAKAGRASRFGPEGTGQTQSGGAQAGETSSTMLPRSKPVTGDVYVQQLGGALPRAKPVAGPVQTQSTPLSAPIDLTGELTEDATASPSSKASGSHAAPARARAKRFGAMDLTAFLDRDAFSSSRKA